MFFFWFNVCVLVVVVVFLLMVWLCLGVLVVVLVLIGCVVGLDFKLLFVCVSDSYIVQLLLVIVVMLDFVVGVVQYFECSVVLLVDWWMVFYLVLFNVLIEQVLVNNYDFKVVQVVFVVVYEIMLFGCGVYVFSVSVGFLVSCEQDLFGVLVLVFSFNVYLYNFFILQVSVLYVFDVFGFNCCMVELLVVQEDVVCYQLFVMQIMLSVNVVVVVVQEVLLQVQLDVMQQLVVINWYMLEIFECQFVKGYVSWFDVVV